MHSRWPCVSLIMIHKPVKTTKTNAATLIDFIHQKSTRSKCLNLGQTDGAALNNNILFGSLSVSCLQCKENHDGRGWIHCRRPVDLIGYSSRVVRRCREWNKLAACVGGIISIYTILYPPILSLSLSILGSWLDIFICPAANTTWNTQMGWSGGTDGRTD